LFVIRDHLGTTPLANLQATLTTDLLKIWHGLAKPHGLGDAKLEDYFDLGFEALPHKVRQMAAVPSYVDPYPNVLIAIADTYCRQIRGGGGATTQAIHYCHFWVGYIVQAGLSQAYPGGRRQSLHGRHLGSFIFSTWFLHTYLLSILSRNKSRRTKTSIFRRNKNFWPSSDATRLRPSRSRRLPKALDLFGGQLMVVMSLKVSAV
jgi:hypothetical protein